MSRSVLSTGLLAAGVALAAVGCSGADEPSALPSGSAPTTSGPAPVTSTAAPTSAAPTPSTGTKRSPVRWLGAAATGPQLPVQEATKAYWSMVLRLSERPDPLDPALAELTLSPQQDTLVAALTAATTGGLSQRGPVDGTVTVPTVSGSTATARACLDQRLVKVYGRDGKPRAGATGARTLFTLTLRKDGPTWKVSNVAGRDGAC